MWSSRLTLLSLEPEKVIIVHKFSHTAPYGDRGLVSNTGLLQLTPGFPLGILKSMGTLVTACCTSFLTLQASVVDL